jgi:hypothetical protein
MKKIGCGRWLRLDDDYGFIVCGDIVELKSGKESKPKLCNDCRKRRKK